MINVVASIIFDEKNNFLLAQRTYPEKLADNWEFPGGKKEKNESSKEAIKREVKEELNIKIRKVKKRITLKHSYKDQKIYFEVFTSKLASSKESLKLDDHKKITWTQPSNLKKYDLADADEKIARKFFKDTSFSK